MYNHSPLATTSPICRFFCNRKLACLSLLKKPIKVRSTLFLTVGAATLKPNIKRIRYKHAALRGRSLSFDHGNVTQPPGAIADQFI